MSVRARAHLTPEEYLALEREADYKSEYLAGEMFAMSGVSPADALIASNIGAELGAALQDRPCFVFISDLRLRVDPTGLYTYPDVMVVCGELQYADDQKDTVLNPCLLVEVLSPSTQDYDRGGKFAHYRSIDSVVDYLLVAQDRHHVELFTRAPEGRWIFTETDGEDAAVELVSIQSRLELSRIYAKVASLPQQGPILKPA